MADEQICIHTAQGMVCYRNQSVPVLTGVKVDFELWYTGIPRRTGHVQSTKFHAASGVSIPADTGRAKLDLLFDTLAVPAVADALHDLNPALDLDDWHTITRMHN